MRENNGKVIVYRILENGEESKYLETDIFIQYLTQGDRENIVNGIKVNGKENLNKMLEDFE